MAEFVKPVSFRSRTTFDRYKLWLLALLVVLSGWGMYTGYLQLGAAALLAFCAVATYHFVGKSSQTSLLGGLFGGSRTLSFTREGKYYMALVMLLWLIALNTGVNLLFLILGLMVCAIAISAVLSEVSMWKLALSWNLPSYAFAGESFPVSTLLRNGKRLLPSISLSVEEEVSGSPVTGQGRSFVLMVSPGAQVAVRRLLRVHRRGMFKLDEVKVSTRFPFGFFEKSSTYASRRAMLIYPRLGSISRRLILAPGAHEQEFGENRVARKGVDRFYGLREYRPGDNPKHIHWKSSARLNKPLVKEFEKEEEGRVLLLLDSFVEHESSGEVFERALSFTATLARDLARENYVVSLGLASPTPTRIDAGRGSSLLHDIYRALALAKASNRPVVPELLRIPSDAVDHKPWLVLILLDQKHLTHQARGEMRRLGGFIRVIDMAGDTSRFFKLE